MVGGLSTSLKVAGVTNDSDEENDVSKMDLGKSGKGPMNRFDFDNEEDYGDYMAKREGALLEGTLVWGTREGTFEREPR